MISPDQIKSAYDEFLEKDEAHFQAEERRIEATQTRENAYNAAFDEAVSMGITDEAKKHQWAVKNTKLLLEEQHVAEKATRKAAHEYKQSGIKVDSLNKQVESAKVALQK